MTKIEWMHRPGTKGETWNPIVGCSIVSPGCTHCYAMRMAARIEAMGTAERSRAHAMSYAGELESDGRPTAPKHYVGTTQPSKAGPVWTGKVALALEHILTAPLRAKAPRTYFVNSMGDVFHESVPDDWIDCVWAVMALCPQHTFLVLTKRAARMRAYFEDDDVSMRISCTLAAMLDGEWIHGPGKTFRQQIENMISLALGVAPDNVTRARAQFLPLPNVWLGVSAERQAEADARIPDLLETPAAIRFVSAEPLLGPLRLDHISGTQCLAGAASCCRGTTYVDALRGIQACERAGAFSYPEKGGKGTRLDWVIAGGESGRDARPMHPDWARALRDQCAAASTPFFFKQWGEWIEHGSAWGTAAVDDVHGPHWRYLDADGTPHRTRETSARCARAMERVGKARAGRLLDGREHIAWPEVAP